MKAYDARIERIRSEVAAALGRVPPGATVFPKASDPTFPGWERFDGPHARCTFRRVHDHPTS